MKKTYKHTNLTIELFDEVMACKRAYGVSIKPIGFMFWKKYDQIAIERASKSLEKARRILADAVSNKYPELANASYYSNSEGIKLN